MVDMTASPGAPLKGEVRPPGDKSISHRAVLMGALSVGECAIDGLLEGQDVLDTVAAFRAMGVEITRHGPGRWSVFGVGLGGLAAPDDVLDMGNSGTGARLIMGVAAAHPFSCVIGGDSSLRRRPMGRVIAPLRRMGAEITPREGGLLPAHIAGAETLLPIIHESPVASAQVKSALLLAGLMAPGATSVIEPHQSRDHGERMLRAFGADVRCRDLPDGRHEAQVAGFPELHAPGPLSVPADFSSAAFPMVAALITPGSDIMLRDVGLNPTRTGLLTTLQDMGGAIDVGHQRTLGGEPVGDLRIRHAPLRGVTVPGARAPSMIDEYPVLAVAAAFAEGVTTMQDVGELRVKESDRIATVLAGLQANGVTARADADSFAVEGAGSDDVPGGGCVAVDGDHRIAMSFLTMGLAAQAPVRIDDATAIDTSFPGFAGLMRDLGGELA